MRISFRDVINKLDELEKNNHARYNELMKKLDALQEDKIYANEEKDVLDQEVR